MPFVRAVMAPTVGLVPLDQANANCHLLDFFVFTGSVSVCNILHLDGIIRTCLLGHSPCAAAICKNLTLLLFGFRRLHTLDSTEYLCAQSCMCRLFLCCHIQSRQPVVRGSAVQWLLGS